MIRETFLCGTDQFMPFSSLQVAISAVAGILKQLKRAHKKVPICPYEISRFYLIEKYHNIQYAKIF